MALKFKLVMRKNLGEDHESIPEKVYAQMVYGDLVTFDEFAEEVADSSGVGSASVKAVLDRMNCCDPALNERDHTSLQRILD